jgi:hypothetical protein
MNSTQIQIDFKYSEEGKMLVNVECDQIPMPSVLLALEKAKDHVMEVFEMACKANNANTHYDRKLVLQKTDFKSAKSF